MHAVKADGLTVQAEVGGAPRQTGRRTPLHHWHLAHGGRLESISEWLISAGYPDGRTQVGLTLADISFLPKTMLLGRGVSAATEILFGESAASAPRGIISIDDGSVACRLSSDRLLLLPARFSTTVFDERLEKVTNLIRRDVTAAYAGFQLGGEGIGKLLGRLTSLDVSTALLPSTCAETGLAGVHALLVRLPDEVFSSLRIYVAWDIAEYLWEQIIEAARPEGIRPVVTR